MTNEALQSFVMRHPGHCSGMFWRGNPFTGRKPTKLPDWPRNGSVLRGTVHHLDPASSIEGCTEWLEVKEYRQNGSSEFTTLPEDTWMQFDQGGRLLHPENK